MAIFKIKASKISLLEPSIPINPILKPHERRFGLRNAGKGSLRRVVPRPSSFYDLQTQTVTADLNGRRGGGGGGVGGLVIVKDPFLEEKQKPTCIHMHEMSFRTTNVYDFNGYFM